MLYGQIEGVIINVKRTATFDVTVFFILVLAYENIVIAKYMYSS